MYEIKYKVDGVPFVGIAYVAANNEKDARFLILNKVDSSEIVSVTRLDVGTIIFAGCE